MAKFKYRMQNVLGIKEKFESQAKTEFAAANAVVEEEKEKLLILGKRKNGYLEKAKELFSRVPLNVREITENEAAILKMDDLIAEQEENVKRAEHFLEQQRVKLTVAMQERKTHEILRERAFEEFWQEEKAAESKEIDQLTSYTYGQKTKDDRNG